MACKVEVNRTSVHLGVSLVVAALSLATLSAHALEPCSPDWGSYYFVSSSETCQLGSSATDQLILHGSVLVDTSSADFSVVPPGNLTISSNGSIISLQSEVYERLQGYSQALTAVEECQEDLLRCTGTVPPEEIPLGTLPENSSLVVFCEMYDAGTADRVFNFSYNVLDGLQEAGGRFGVPSQYTFSIPEDS